MIKAISQTPSYSHSRLLQLTLPEWYSEKVWTPPILLEMFIHQSNFIQGHAVSTQWNNAGFRIEAENWELNENQLKALLKINIAPDLFQPKGRRKKVLRIHLNATLEKESLQAKVRFVKLNGFCIPGIPYKNNASKPIIDENWKEIKSGMIHPILSTPTPNNLSKSPEPFILWSVTLYPSFDSDFPDLNGVLFDFHIQSNKVFIAGAAPFWKGSSWKRYRCNIEQLSINEQGIRGRIGVPQAAFHPMLSKSELFFIDCLITKGMDYLVCSLEPIKLPLKSHSNISINYFGRGQIKKCKESLDAIEARFYKAKNQTKDAWFAPIQGFKPVQSGEHPRLFFRTNELRKLRKRSKSTDGLAILSRLRELLGEDGEKITTDFNPAESENISTAPPIKRIGVFTMWHATGFGILYQITGRKNYAKLSAECAQLMLDGAMDRDNRYGFKEPGGPLRAGYVLMALATAYDLCYQAWTPEFRKKIAHAIVDYQHKDITIQFLSGRTHYPPSSNHYGAHFGGTGVALMAINHDPELDIKRQLLIDKRLNEIECMVPQMLTEGFGDHGWFAEGPHPGRISANTGLLDYFIAARKCLGKEYFQDETSHAPWLILRHIMEMVNREDKPEFPNRGNYGGDPFIAHASSSQNGDFLLGFANLPQPYRSALQWTYENTLEKGELLGKDRVKDLPFWRTAGQKTYNISVYPHQALHALLHWPMDEKANSPENIMPKHYSDHIHGYYFSRGEWNDSKDRIVSFYLGIGPKGYHPRRKSGIITIWTDEYKWDWQTDLSDAIPLDYKIQKNGSFSLLMEKEGLRSQLFVNFSKKTSPGLVIIGLGPGFTLPTEQYDKDSHEKPKLEDLRIEGVRGKAFVYKEKLSLPDYAESIHSSLIPKERENPKSPLEAPNQS